MSSTDESSFGPIRCGRMLFEDSLRNDPELAAALAHLMFNMLEAAAKSEKEIEKLRNTLKDGIEWIYPFTGAHKAAFKAYLLQLERKMAVEDNPETLMRQAIARALNNRKVPSTTRSHSKSERVASSRH